MTLPSSATTMLHAMPSFDELLDLPPLQSSFPLSTSAASLCRPLPLEPSPNGRISVDSEAVNVPLSGRQKALAQAKPLEDTDLESNRQPEKPLVNVPNPEQARKKAKLKHNEQIADFVHLPKPQATKPKEEKRRSFHPIAVQTLHEPPPSAALFPPITENQQVARPSNYPKLLPNGPTSQKRTTKRQTPPKKRVYLRERVRWTEAETDYLVKGVAIYGMGRWKTILEHPEFHFSPVRTHVDLKDRFRVVFPSNAPDKWVRPLPDPTQENGTPTKSEPQSPGKPRRLRRKKRPWSEEEDDELDKGFETHGFAWDMIAKDERLCFDNRSCNQIRDRFRLRYPESYDEHVAPPQDPTKKRRRGTTKAIATTDARSKEESSAWPDRGENFQHEDDDEAQDVEPRAPAGSSSKTTAPTSTTTTGGASDWLTDLLTQDDPGPDPDPDPDPDPGAKMTASFSQYDWEDTGADSLALAPIRWEDMAVPQMPFDLG